jgi:hypothetical protein
VKKRKGGTRNFRISKLGVLGFQMSNNSANISRSSEKVRWDPKFWDLELGVSGFQMSTTAQDISRGSEKVKWDPLLRDFRTRGFGVSNVNNHARHFPRFRKGKVGPATLGFGIYEHGVWCIQPQKKKENRKGKVEASGFRDSELREFRIHTSIYTNLER